MTLLTGMWGLFVRFSCRIRKMDVAWLKFNTTSNTHTSSGGIDYAT